MTQNKFQTSDAGGSILTHAFGAFYGVGLNFGLGIKPKHIPEENRKTNKVADTFALVGTIVLWMFWPSFNGTYTYMLFQVLYQDPFAHVCAELHSFRLVYFKHKEIFLVVCIVSDGSPVLSMPAY